jgi:DNA-binding NarL/FixJ family response regulator
MIKLVIIDDQSILSKGLSLLLNDFDDIQIVGIGSNGFDAIRLLNDKKPDVFLMDVKMNGMDGIEALSNLKRLEPKVGVILLSTFNDEDYILRGIKEGMDGYLLKSSSIEEIYDAISKVSQGISIIDPHLTQMLFDNLKIKKDVHTPKEELSPREVDIMRLISDGLSNEEISKELFITEGTVKNQISKILFKLELRDRTQLAIYYLKNH